MEKVYQKKFMEREGDQITKRQEVIFMVHIFDLDSLICRLLLLTQFFSFDVPFLSLLSETVQKIKFRMKCLCS